MPPPASRLLPHQNGDHESRPYSSPADGGHARTLAGIANESPKFASSQLVAGTTVVQMAAIVTTSFAGMSAQLLGRIQPDGAMNEADAAGPLLTLLLAASYAAILFNTIATVGALFLINQLDDIGLNEARKRDDLNTNGTVEPSRSSSQLLRKFGGHPNLKYIFIQWIVYLSIGVLSILLQTLTYIWLHEGRAASIIMTVLTGSAIAGLFFTSYFPMDFFNTAIAP